MKTLALLRGINVGGKNILPMKALAEIFRAAGCTDVQTFIQSGNVVFTAPPGLDVALRVRQQIDQQFAIKVPVVLRSLAEIRLAIANNPFLKSGIDSSWLHVMFLEHEPTKEQLVGLDAHRSAPDEFVVIGRDIYLHLPNGAARTKLTNAYFDSKLKTVGTQRNWNTVLQLAQMMEL
jgi:uncharacterized protein (DUF1697 family)